MLARLAPVAGKVALALAVLYGVLVGLGLLLTRVLETSPILDPEEDLEQALADGRSLTMNDVTWVLSGLGNTGAIIGALAVVALALRLVTKKWGPSIFLVLAVSAQALVFLFVQLTIKRDRPDVKRLDNSPPTSSYPSGHTGAATALFIASALLVAWYVRRRWVRILALLLLVAVPLLVAYGRMYRGMHHPTDILGAYVNGLTCIAVSARNVLGRRWPWGRREADPLPAPAMAGATSTP